MEPFDVMDAGRMAVCTDPEGAVFCVWQAKEHKGAQIVNEPGSLNFNGLNTRDAEGAKEFYGSVFGWETLGLGGGAEMWTLPGYGDFLEQNRSRAPQAHGGGRRPGGLRGRGRGINPIPDDQPDAPPHWSVTFAVDDADATADEGRGAGRPGGRPAVRCPLGPDDRDHRPAGRDVHRQQVRAGEQGPRQPGRFDGRGRVGQAPRRAARLASEAAARPERRLDSSSCCGPCAGNPLRPCWPLSWPECFSTRSRRAATRVVRCSASSA